MQKGAALMSNRFFMGQRIALTVTPILAKHIPAGTTGTVIGHHGYRAYNVLCDGDHVGVPVFPETMRRLSAGEASVPVPPHPKLPMRGKKK